MIYKIVLDSYDTISFIGTQFDVSYYIDFNKIIINQEDFNKLSDDKRDEIDRFINSVITRHDFN